MPGVIPAADWVYYDGALDICDRQWETNVTWSYDLENPFNGKRCAKLTPGPGPARLTQSGLSARKGMQYNFATFMRGARGMKVTVQHKTRLPDGSWFILASARLPGPSSEWGKDEVKMTSMGQTDHAVFEFSAEGRAVFGSTSCP